MKFLKFLERKTASSSQSLPPPSLLNYEPLPTTGDWIRLLTLHPGNPSDEVVLTLAPALLSGNETPKYEALSYVWGDPKGPHDPVKIGTPPVTLNVRRNLFLALQHLRHPSEPRVLWVDAVCINQVDLREQSLQLARMGKVYRLADRVVIWLGTANPADDAAISILQDIGSKIEVNWANQTMEPSPYGRLEPEFADHNIPVPVGPMERAIVDSILDRPWFSRVWVIQETRLASSKTICVCGHSIIEWNTLHKALYCIRAKGYELHTTGVYYKERQATIVDTFNRSKIYPLWEILEVTRPYKCTKDQDRVYAMLGIVSDSLGIVPDCSLSVQEVYMDVVRRGIESGRCLDILTACDTGSNPRPGWPTWLPDWSKPKRTSSIAWGYAGGFTMPEATFVDDHILRVAAVRCGTITQCTEFFIEEVHKSRAGQMALFSEIRRLKLPIPMLDKPYKGGGTILEALCGSLTCFQFHRFDPPRSDLPELHLSTELIRMLFDTPEELLPESPDEDGRFTGLFDRQARGRALFLTDERRMGLCPASAQVGDQIFVLPGCCSPLLLRPVPHRGWWHRRSGSQGRTNGTRYQVIGECFVYGLHQAEALFGSFPETYEYVSRWKEGRGQYVAGSCNKDTGSLYWTDPRLFTLGIREGLDEQTGIKMTTVDSLKKIGVNVEYVELI